MNLAVSVDQKQLLDILLNVGIVRPVFIWGAPGIGKSAIVEQFAADMGLPCVSLLGSQLAPEDIIGVPQIVNGRSVFCPPKMIAREEPYCLFLDELNACSQEVQKAFYSLILERRIGEYHLPKGSIVIGAGNRAQDSIFVARLSETALTAASLVYAIQFLMIAIAVGTAVGLNALLSRKLGQKKPEEACRAATTGLFLMLGTSLVFTLVGLLFSNQIAAALTNDPELQELCREYLSVNLVFCWGIFLQTYGQRLLQAVGDTVLSMVSLIIGAVVNIILDPIMIFGLLGCPAMGIRGAAIATVIGQLIGAAAALWFNRVKNPVIHVRLKGYRFLWQDVADIYRVGLPTIVMQAIGSVMTFAVNSILLGVSSTAVAFFGIYYKLQNFLMMPVNGLGQAAIPVVGFNYGSGQSDRVKQAWKVLLPTGVVFALCGTAVFLLFPAQLLGLFSASDEMLAFGVPALRIISVTFLFAVTTILCGYFASGLGNGVINMIGGALRQLVVLVPCLWVLIRTVGIDKAWFAFWASEVVACAYSFWAVQKELRNKVK